MEAVTSVLMERSRESGGLRKMIAVSLTLHVLACVALIAGPFVWQSKSSNDIQPVMTINLGGSGAPGPMNGGSNPLPARAVQQAEPNAEPRQPQRAPAARTPEMTMPSPKSKPAKAAPSKGTESEGSDTAARGATARPGSALADTGGFGSGFGLSTGGFGGNGSYLEGITDFCCPEYINTMLARIQSNWNAQMGVAAQVTVKFTIRKDGSIVDVQTERPTGNYALDSGAERAVLRTAKLPPLPGQFNGDHLTVHLVFQYTQ